MQTLFRMISDSGIDMVPRTSTALVRKGEQTENIGTSDRPTALLTDLLGGGAMSDAGVRVSATLAMTLMDVNGCVRLLRDTFSQVPVKVFQRLDVGKRPATDHWSYELIHDQPAPWLTTSEWRALMIVSVLLRGNGYSFLERSNRDAAVERIIPLHPDDVSVKVADDGEPIYAVKDRYERMRSGDYPRYKLFHMKGCSYDGYVGVSPIEEARQAIGLGLIGQKFASKMIGSGARLSGILSYDGGLSQDQRKEFGNEWNANMHGADKAGRTAILDKGWSWQSINMKADDAQLLGLLQQAGVEVRKIFRCPPHLLGDTEKQSSWGTGVEQTSIGFVTYTMAPHFVNFEQAAYRDIIRPTDTNRSYFIECNVAGLLRGDIKSRYVAYATGRQWGWLSANDVLELESRNPIGEQGDTYLSPLNMSPADQLRDLIASMIDSRIATQDGGNQPNA